MNIDLNRNERMSSPLAGLKVIDFGHYYAGPMVGMMLADQGATVIRILNPAGPELREHEFRLLNRNKKLLTLDLKSEDDGAQALSLIEKADVLIENFRPGVMKRLGLDYASVKDSNPGLIYLSLPGFPATDKARAPIQAWEGVVGAATGLYREVHLQRETLGFPPVFTAVPLNSMYAGTNGAVAVMAALLARENHTAENGGYGTQLEVPLVNAGLIGTQIHISMKRPFFELRRGIEDRSHQVPDVFKNLAYSPEDTPDQMADKLEKARHLSMKGPLAREYRCADGREIWINTFFSKPIISRLLKVLGVEKQLFQEGYINEGAHVVLDNNVSAITGLSAERGQQLQDKLAAVFITKPAQAWEEILTQAGVLAAVIRSREEWLALEALLESGVFTRLGSGSEALVMPGPAGVMSGPGGEQPDNFTDAIAISPMDAEALFSCQLNRQQRQQPRGAYIPQTKGELLRGLKVLDMSNVVAGPMGAEVLAEYGAEVIEATGPNSYPFIGVLGARGVTHAGKRSILTELNTEPGRQVFQRLVKWADVVTHNILDDTARRLGVAHDQLQAINPQVVSCQISAYGGTRRGGWEKRPGYDWTLHAASGQMAQFGSLEQAHIHGEGATADIVAGFTMAFTALLGVYQQRKTGFAGEGRTSLAMAINYSELPNMIASQGKCDWGTPQGQFALGWFWWQRMYQCSDGWLFVGCTEDRAGLLAKTVTPETLALETFTPGESVDALALEEAFLQKDMAYWQDRLQGVDIGCYPVGNAETILDNAGCVYEVNNETVDEYASNEHSILRWNNHPFGLPYIAPEPSAVRVGENRSYLRLGVPPKVGENTREILLDLGYSAVEADELIRLKVCHEFLPAIGNREDFLFNPAKY